MDFINKIKPIWEAERPGEPLPVGYGMDANGIADRAGPRGAGSTPVQYPCTLFQGPDWGPTFKGIKPVVIELQTISPSSKRCTIAEDGNEHHRLNAEYGEEYENKKE